MMLILLVWNIVSFSGCVLGVVQDGDWIFYGFQYGNTFNHLANYSLPKTSGQIQRGTTPHKSSTNQKEMYCTEVYTRISEIIPSETGRETAHHVCGSSFYCQTVQIDSVSGLIYFTEGIGIAVMKWEGRHSFPLSSDYQGFVFALALYPTRGKLYWFDFGGIKEAIMDGSNPKVLDTTTTYAIFSLILDIKGERLYWIQASSLATIQSLSINGGDKRTVSLLDGGTGLTFFGQNLYYEVSVNTIWYITTVDKSKLSQRAPNISELIFSNPLSDFAMNVPAYVKQNVREAITRAAISTEDVNTFVCRHQAVVAVHAGMDSMFTTTRSASLLPRPAR